MSVVLWIALFILTFVGMEFVAWAAHKYVMHGFLWSVHRDHHVKTPGFFEKNDLFFLIFAIPSWLGIMLGMIYHQDWAVSVGFGIAAYGLAYFAVHEVYIHRRFSWWKKTDNFYFRAVLRAHKMHHKHLGKEDGESFGMLLIHPRYWKAEQEAELQAQSRSANRQPKAVS